MKETSTIQAFQKDRVYLGNLKKKKGFVSIKVTLSKIVKMIKKHKLEEEII